MKEFGSDFHKCSEGFAIGKTLNSLFAQPLLYANGRHAIEALIRQEGWVRIWIPAYFCNEVIEHIKGTGINVILYNDYPSSENDSDVVRSLDFKQGDVLLRVNYFGLRTFRSNSDIPIPVIEDHSHGIMTDWALRSNADWCIASLRKTLPIATGGILWSPTGKKTPIVPPSSNECMDIAIERWDAMNLKAEYLSTSYSNIKLQSQAKEEFRQKYINSERRISNLEVCGIDSISKNFLDRFDIYLWTEQKAQNWSLAIDHLDERIEILSAKNRYGDGFYPFSLVMLMPSDNERDRMLQYLMTQNVYPAVLWRLPESSRFKEALNFSSRMLSIHCDARYNEAEIIDLCNKINSYYDASL